MKKEIPQNTEKLNIQSHTPIWQCETKDSAEGHSCNLDYFQDERATNCVGQLEQRLWAAVGLMSKQQPGKLTMCATLRPTSDDCSHITVCTAVTFSRAWSSWYCSPAMTQSCMYIWYFHYVCFNFSCPPAPVRQRQTHVHLLYLAIKAILIDDGARNWFSLLN